MSLEEKLSAADIVVLAGMASRPSYYSGLGATTTDLNAARLEKIYNGIEQNYGKDAAENFVKMVADIPKLSATDFLLTLYSLEANRWKWNKKFLRKRNGTHVDGEAVAFATVMGVMSGDNARDETPVIRRAFLAAHIIKAPR